MNETRSENALDELLGKIVDEYLSALADGKKPDIKEYEDRYPEVAQTLRVAIPAILVATGSHPNDGNEGSQKEQRIGDFRILRQIGRGGMGIVYEAEQISMARNVALKVLPFAGLVDDLKIKRFQNEVRAVAALDHPNIVSVYMVGHERGVHYYAMQLIRGQNLAQVISSLRASKQNGDSLDGAALTETGLWSSSHANDESLSAGVGSGPAVETVLDNMDSTIPQESEHDYFRNVAILGVQAAKALQHAHDQGIVHRDIKPANLLLDRDANLYLTDFGLARIETDAGLTMTGDLIGTLRYMAPEQALGHRVGIDHRADIYSLAATIYELLALRPAFDAEDRQKLLKQIAFEDPAPLRSVAPNIPVDLETIVRKAMSKGHGRSVCLQRGAGR